MAGGEGTGGIESACGQLARVDQPLHPLSPRDRRGVRGEG
jgi:hypothetical protein